MKKLVDEKFEKIITGNRSAIKENTLNYTKSFLEDVYTQELEIKTSELRVEKDNNSKKIQEYERSLLKAQIENLHLRKKEVARDLDDKKTLQKKLDKKAFRKKKFNIIMLIFALIAYIVFLLCVLKKRGWDFVEPFTWIIPIFCCMIMFVIEIIREKEFNPKRIIISKFSLSEIKKKYYEKSAFSENELKDLEQDKNDIFRTLEQKQSDLFYNTFDISNLTEILSEQIIINVPCLNKDNVYMRISKSNFENENRFLVFLDRNKMINTPLLCKGFFEENSIIEKCKIYENESERKKVDDCILGFSYGKSNPVPVSEISIYNCEIRFTNGMTRFSWLIAAGAYIIPVECRREDAEEVAKLYGKDNFITKSIKDYYVKD